MTKRKFYKTTIKAEVLSEEPIPDTMSLEDIARESIEGDYSFIYDRKKEQLLNGNEVAKALRKQSSDPGFFRLDDDGNDSE